LEYPVERFDPHEREHLRAHFTNLDQQVFAPVNLPDTIKGARSPATPAFRHAAAALSR